MRDKHTEVMEKYDEEYPDKTTVQRARDLKNRCKIARRLFEELATEQQQVYEDKATKQHEQDMAEFTRNRATLSCDQVPAYSRQLE